MPFAVFPYLTRERGSFLTRGMQLAFFLIHDHHVCT